MNVLEEGRTRFQISVNKLESRDAGTAAASAGAGQRPGPVQERRRAAAFKLAVLSLSGLSHGASDLTRRIVTRTKAGPDSTFLKRAGFYSESVPIPGPGCHGGTLTGTVTSNSPPKATRDR